MSERPKVLILGLPFFGRILEGELAGRGWAARYLPHPGRSLSGWATVPRLVREADVLYLVSSRLDRGSPQDLLMRLRRKPVLIHWNGTDVMIARDEYLAGKASHAIAERAVHWADAPWLIDELREIGIESEYVSLPVAVSGTEPPPLPSRFTALLYLPVDAFDREVFDAETLLRLPHEFPDTHFILVPSLGETLASIHSGPLPPNLETPGYITDMDAFYRKISVLIRLTTHDGTSHMALECLSRGRQVIWTYSLPGVIQARGPETVIATLRDLIARHAAGTLSLNEEGRTYALSHFDRESLVRTIDTKLRALLH